MAIFAQKLAWIYWFRPANFGHQRNTTVPAGNMSHSQSAAACLCHAFALFFLCTTLYIQLPWLLL